MNIDKLKQVIQEANPEIMELKFGCQIICDNGRIENLIDELSCDNNAHTPDNLEIAGSFKILGRPIRLADVIWAVDKLYRSGDNNEKKCEVAFDLWNLKDNNLDYQSDFTK